MFWTKRLFNSAGDVAVDAHDVAAAQRWYAEKLGLRYSSTEVEEASMELGYSPDDVVVYLTEVSGNERPDVQPRHPPIIFARKLPEAHEYLSSGGVDVGSIQSDSGGNQFFRFRDLEGNELEVYQER
jgi:catechol 2,3-dioxygenase-like lactoylglutathione lyase family enzyme